MDRENTIQYFNRYTQCVESERIYGEKWLRRVYEKPAGRLVLSAAVKRLWFSRFYGWRMNQPGSRKKVRPFCRAYHLDTSHFELPVENYKTFNDFFSRRLKPESRPVEPRNDAVLFPVDGRHLGFQDITQIDGLHVKGQAFNLPALFQDEALAHQYRNGSLVVSRLCPVDCHRIYFPVAGNPGKTRLLNGFLYSVNPIALKKNPAILWENKRCLTILLTERFGRVLMMEVGATCVGTIRQTYVPGKSVSGGSEKGYFRFGGSMVLTFFERGRVKLADDLLENTLQGRELYAHLCDFMGAA